jgi:hypothetical protein
MLPRWFFLIVGQGGQCKLHWSQNLAALPKDGAGLASQRGGQPPNRGPLPSSGDRRLPPPVGGAARRAVTPGRPTRATRAGPRRPDPPLAGAGGTRVGPGSACGGAGLGQARPGLPPRARPGPTLPFG